MRYERKTVKAVRGTDRIVVAKWQKRGWELVDQTSGTVRTDLTFQRPKPRVTRQSLAVVALVVALVGVIAIGALTEQDNPGKRNDTGAPKPDPVKSGSAAAASSPMVNATYSSVGDLIDAAIKAGYPCPSRKVTKDLHGKERGECSDIDVFSLVDTTYRGEGEMQQVADDLEKELSDDPVLNGATYLVGPNWGIQCSATWAVKLQKKLGGAIATVP